MASAWAARYSTSAASARSRSGPPPGRSAAGTQLSIRTEFGLDRAGRDPGALAGLARAREIDAYRFPGRRSPGQRDAPRAAHCLAQHHVERGDHRLLAHRAATAAEHAPLVQRLAPAPRARHVHQPDRLGGRRAAGSRDAGAGDRNVGMRVRQRTLGHRARHGLAHRALLGDVCTRHAEKLDLRVIRIGDEAALDHLGRTRHLGQGRGDQPAGAGFRGRETKPPFAAGLKHAARVALDIRRDHRRYAGTCVTAHMTARA